MYVCACVCACVFVCVFECVFLCMCMHMCVYMCVCIYTHVRMCGFRISPEILINRMEWEVGAMHATCS